MEEDSIMEVDEEEYYGLLKEVDYLINPLGDPCMIDYIGTREFEFINNEINC